MSEDALRILTAVALLVGLVGAAYGTWRRFKPGAQRVSAALDAVIGKAPVIDRAGNEMEPGQPGLVHRVATVEEAVVELRHVTALYIETQKRIDLHDHRIKALEDSRVEQLVTRAESAQMWRAVADNTTDEPE